jgi:hypothetical protein
MSGYKIQMPPSVGVTTRVDGWLLDPGATFADDVSIRDAPARVRALVRHNAKDQRPFIREIRQRMLQRMRAAGLDDV